MTKTYIRQGKHNQIRAVGKINPKPPFLGNIAYARCAQGIGHASFFESVYHGAEKDEIGMPYAPPTGLMRETEDIFLKKLYPIYFNPSRKLPNVVFSTAAALLAEKR